MKSFLSLKKKKISWIIILTLAAVSLLCFFLRVKNLGRLSFWMDEGFSYLAVEAILHKGYPLYPSGNFYFKAILYMYILSLFSSVLGLSEFSLRFVSVLVSVLTLPVVYAIGKKFFNKPAAFVSVLILAFSGWEMEYSRTAGYYPFLQLFFLLGLYFFYLGFFEEKAGYKEAATVLFILTPLLHQIGLALIFAFLALILIEGVRRFFQRDCLVRFALVGLFYLLIEINEVFFWKVGYVYTPKDHKLSTLFSEYFTSFNLHYFREFQIAFPTMSFVVLGSFFILAGMILMVRKVSSLPEIKKWLFLFLCFLLPLVFTGFVKSHAQPRYVYFLRPLFVLLFSYGLYKLVEFILEMGFNPVWSLLKKNSAKYKTALYLPAFFLAVIFTVDDVSLTQIQEIIGRDYQDRITTNLVTRTGRFAHPDHRGAGEFVREHAGEDDIIIAVHVVFQYIYAGRVDRWLWTGGPGTWDAWEKTDEGWRDVYIGAGWINTLDGLEDMIKSRHEQRVWLITSPSVQRRDHINREIANFLERNEDRTVFIARDGVSRVYLWSDSAADEKLRSPGYEAEWFFPQTGMIRPDDAASQGRTLYFDSKRPERSISRLSLGRRFMPGAYMLRLRVKTDDRTAGRKLLSLAAVSKKDGEKLLALGVWGTDFITNDVYQDIVQKFLLSEPDELELQLQFMGQGKVWLDYLQLIQAENPDEAAGSR